MPMHMESWIDTPLRKDTSNPSCLSDTFARPNRNITLWYNSDVTAEPGIEYDSHTARITKEQILDHVDLMRLAGFVLTYEYKELPADFRNKKGPTKNGEVHMGHAFTVNAGTMTPTMRRFCINGIRWCSENLGCRVAYAELIKEVKDTTVVLDCFNMFVVACLADTRSGNHNIGSTTGYVKPFSKELFEQMNDHSLDMNYMMRYVSQVTISDSPYRAPNTDFKFLQKRGGWAIYQKRLEDAKQYTKEGTKYKLDTHGILKEALGMNTGGAAAL